MSDFTISEDLQLSGIEDDGLLGRMVVKPVATDVVLQPFGTGHMTQTGGSVRNSLGENEANNAMAINGTVSAGIANNWTLRHRFNGRVYGLSVNRRDCDDIDILIDGLAYRVKSKLYRWDTNTVTAIDSGTNVLLVDDTLPDIEEHEALLLIPGGSGSKTIDVYGYAAERRMGHEPLRSISRPASNITLNGNSSFQTLYNGQTNRTPYGIDAFIIRNATASGANRTVLLKWSGLSGSPILIEKIIAPGDTIIVSLPARLVADTSNTWTGAVVEADSTNVTLTVCGSGIR